MQKKHYDAVIVGGGHNWLVCSFYLANAGLKVKVLERRSIVGGAAVTEEFYPGFKNSTASYTVCLLNPTVINDMHLKENRLKIIRESSDGYQIAKEDMLIRGYGDIFGFRQSGFRDFKVLNENLISEIGKKAEDDSKRILNGILSNVEQKSRYKRLFDFYEAHEYKYIIS